MNGRAILIADKDDGYRSRLTDYFQRAGYRVKAVDGAEAALNSVLESATSVLLLGSNVSESAALPDLIRLLKGCNSQMPIIMMGDDMTLAETRQVRAAGIFFQALKPISDADTDELGQVVACALEERTNQASALLPALAMAAATSKLARLQLKKALSWMAGIIALVFGAGLTALQVKPAEGNSFTLWIFLGFLALVVTNQLLPIFRVKLVLESLKEWKTARSGAHRGGK
jgi:FixJ family two-component response regulator